MVSVRGFRRVKEEKEKRRNKRPPTFSPSLDLPFPLSVMSLFVHCLLPWFRGRRNLCFPFPWPRSRCKRRVRGLEAKKKSVGARFGLRIALEKPWRFLIRTRKLKHDDDDDDALRPAGTSVPRQPPSALVFLTLLLLLSLSLPPPPPQVRAPLAPQRHGREDGRRPRGRRRGDVSPVVEQQ